MWRSLRRKKKKIQAGLQKESYYTERKRTDKASSWVTKTSKTYKRYLRKTSHYIWMKRCSWEMRNYKKI